MCMAQHLSLSALTGPLSGPQRTAVVSPKSRMLQEGSVTASVESAQNLMKRVNAGLGGIGLARCGNILTRRQPSSWFCDLDLRHHKFDVWTCTNNGALDICIRSSHPDSNCLFASGVFCAGKYPS